MPYIGLVSRTWLSTEDSILSRQYNLKDEDFYKMPLDLPKNQVLNAIF